VCHAFYKQYVQQNTMLQLTTLIAAHTDACGVMSVLTIKTILTYQ